MRRGPLVLVGPSGAGKTTIAKRLAEDHPDLFALSVSATTRAPRVGERPGRDYHFVSRERFGAMIARGELAEWAEVHGERYGTPVASLAPGRRDGRIRVLDIDVQGARRVMARDSSALAIFIVPPGPRRWIDRLACRGTESPGQIARRLRTALRELRAAPAFDELVVNDGLERAVAEIRGLALGRGRGDGAGIEQASRCRLLEEGARSELARIEAALNPQNLGES